ncbi:copper amine oxidase domain-containing protein [Paenibacillus sp. 32O-W]|uniref:copper amine oxidase N-terminal domain-containing protein n=1 Tax=Paenibacillus sp. 32O-W TaxID=1695218 RepID=UPI000721DC37|nr:copper amine oxidase N-terminal domain-containing protein [Paenibacillus sp. 32O-W]ALS25935.1 copper amine oxidase domain-containing protein [Paenibacillus sp. 32O-W]
MLNKTSCCILVIALLLGLALPAAGETSADTEKCGQATAVFRLGSTVVRTEDGTNRAPIAPALLKGNLMVPVTSLAEALGGEAKWNPKTRTVSLTLRGKTLLMKIGNNKPALSGSQLKLPAPVTAVKGNTLVPLRAVAAAFDADTSVNDDKRSVTVRLPSCTETVKVSYTFANSKEGWSGGFADLPVKYSQHTYRLDFKWSAIPLREGAQKYGLQISGMNRSDDLFMYISRKIGKAEGLRPHTTYKVHLSFDLATNESKGLIGAGGSPGESVYVKAGVVNVKPEALEKDNDGTPYYRMNIDHGNQSKSGKDMKVLGNIVKESTAEGYALKSFDGSFTARTDGTGALYLIIGTDSGYEGMTSLYYTNIKASFTKVE